MEFDSAYYRSHGTNLHYYRSGAEKPPLVLVHGITDDGLCWLPVAEPLAKDWDVVMVDMRAHGKSDAPESGYTYETMTRELAGLITGLELEKPVVLGHSMGGRTALLLGGMYPELPKALIIEDAPPLWVMSRYVRNGHSGINPMVLWMEHLKRNTFDDLMEECINANPGWAEAERKPWVDSKHRFSPRIAQLVSSFEVIPADVPATMRKITCPVLFLRADIEKRAASTEEDVASLQALVPHLQVAYFDGAGHNIRRDQYSRYMKTVKEFLETVRE